MRRFESLADRSDVPMRGPKWSKCPESRNPTEPSAPKGMAMGAPEDHMRLSDYPYFVGQLWSPFFAPLSLRGQHWAVSLWLPVPKKSCEIHIPRHNLEKWQRKWILKEVDCQIGHGSLPNSIAQFGLWESLASKDRAEDYHRGSIRSIWAILPTNIWALWAIGLSIQIHSGVPLDLNKPKSQWQSNVSSFILRLRSRQLTESEID